MSNVASAISNIRIVSFERSLDSSLISLSQLTHPTASTIRDRAGWFTYDNPFVEATGRIPGLVAVTDEGEAVGQFMLNHTEWYFSRGRHEGFFGYDFFVKEDYRRSGIGALLLLQAVRTYKPFFALGLSSITKKLCDVAGIRETAHLCKFLWLNKPLSSVRHCFGHYVTKKVSPWNIDAGCFPESVRICDKTFRLLIDIPKETYRPYYDRRTFSFSRSVEFLKWRFFECNTKYYFYYCDAFELPVYFVVRSVLFKGLRLALIVDYKFPIDDLGSWVLALRAAKRVAKMLGWDGVLTGSSNVFADRGLRQEGFFSIGKPACMVSTLSDISEEGLHKNHSAIYVTMGDADFDLNFGDML